MKKLILSLAVLAASSAFAAGTVTGTVTRIYNGVGFILVKSSGTASGVPSCGSGNNGLMSIDITTADGQDKAKTVRLARALNLTLTMNGTNACSQQGNVETVNDLYTD